MSLGSRIRSVWGKVEIWIYGLIPNPSGQDQFREHLLPAFFLTAVLLAVPKVGLFVSFLSPVFALYVELVDDGHWRDIFKPNDFSKYGSADGRCDLFFKLFGCALAYGTWWVSTRF